MLEREQSQIATMLIIENKTTEMILSSHEVLKAEMMNANNNS